MSTPEPTVYFEFVVTVKMYSDQYTPYYWNSSVSLYEYDGDQILGKTVENADQGLLVFHIYFDTLGPKTIIARSLHDSQPGLVGETIVYVKPEAIKASIRKLVGFK